MSDFQAYEIIETMLTNWDTLSKNDIKEQLTTILPLPCPKCNGRYERVQKYGRELDPSTRYDAASTSYIICSNCKHIYAYSY